MDEDLIEIAAQIVTAYVGSNSVPAADLPRLIADVHVAVAALVTPQEAAPQPKEPQTPAVPVKKSITPDYIVSLEDGRKFKSLKRHLLTAHGLTPEEYRAKWGLPADYPMTAPNYSVRRSEMAKSIGLGRPSRPEPAPTKPRGGQKKPPVAG
ncbi:MucR family transcriptional regulator [Mesorhizobium sp. ASY16-5R]|uniref:MucR family transcriptional regulator n=1 Tax=Mesorhizobium sp. ASY16-5R TaxID=3445772 RepID=UPI003FA141E5